MAKGVTLELADYNPATGVGKCIEGHEVKMLTGGYGLCETCLHEIQGYSSLYIPPKGFATPGIPNEVKDG